MVDKLKETGQKLLAACIGTPRPCANLYTLFYGYGPAEGLSLW